MAAPTSSASTRGRGHGPLHFSRQHQPKLSYSNRWPDTGAGGRTRAAAGLARLGRVVETQGTTIDTSDVLRMFPTFVWRAEVAPGVRLGIENGVLRTLNEIRDASAEPARGRGLQSERHLHQRDEFRGLVGCIRDAAKSVLEFLKTGEGAFEITGLWANMNPNDAWHPVHSHPNNFLSGVYYVRTYEGADTINFHDPRPQTAIIRPPVTELTAENTDQVVVKVSDGTLLMFPSWLPHSVDASASDGTRISISFNIMFSAFAEKISKPLW